MFDIVLMVGIPGSGKTTFCRERLFPSHLYISLDQLRTRSAEAELFANVRMLWGDTTESVIRRLRKEMRDPGIEIQKSVCADPRPDSELTEGWDALRSAIRATWPEAVVTPYLMVATTDARHWRDICPNVYRFSAKTVTGEEKATVHGNNERIRVENTLRGAQFFVRLMRQC